MSLVSTGGNIFRWYLSKFPLKDGKAYFYNLLQEKLTPSQRYLVISLSTGFQMKLDLQDLVQRKIYFYGNYDERYEANLVQRVLEYHEVFWDIGANIGFFSLTAAAALNNTGEVKAFEPAKVAYERLLDNIALNPFRNITAYNLAVTDTRGDAVLYLCGDIADGGANLYGSRGEQNQQQPCQTTSLDQLREDRGGRAPDFLKIDVEGAEMAVLKGAEKILATSTPLLLLEMKEGNLLAAGTSKAEIQDLLRRHGYLGCFLRHRAWYVSPDVGEARSRNIFWFNPSNLRHREKAARIPLVGDY